MLKVDFLQMMFFQTDADFLYIENKHCDELDRVGLSGKNLQGKNGYKNGGIFCALFLATKIKYCSTINKYGVFDKHKTFKRFTNVSDSLDRKECFKIYGGDKFIVKIPLSWEKSFSMGVVIPHKMKKGNKYTKYTLCDRCDNLVNQRKESSANLNELKRLAPNEIGRLLPKYITT